MRTHCVWRTFFHIINFFTVEFFICPWDIALSKFCLGVNKYINHCIRWYFSNFLKHLLVTLHCLEFRETVIPQHPTPQLSLPALWLEFWSSCSWSKINFLKVKLEYDFKGAKWRPWRLCLTPIAKAELFVCQYKLSTNVFIPREAVPDFSHYRSPLEPRQVLRSS